MKNNDFTLYELYELSRMIDHGFQCRGDKDELGLINKLDKMIANYCEHDFQNTWNEREVWKCTICECEE
jgi:hypothetical protein